MDMVSSITGLQQAQVMAEVQMRVARRILDTQRFQGQAAVQLIQAASKTASSAGDELVAQATGLGSQIDTYA